MENIEDTGTIWVRGAQRPEHAVRVGGKIFVTGQGDAESVECWVEGPYLYADRHNPASKTRTVLRFDLNLAPSKSGSPFKGFTNTSHKDTQVVTYADAGVEEFSLKDGDYNQEGYGSLESREFAARAVFKPRNE